jgi:hypothetical protein
MMQAPSLDYNGGHCVLEAKRIDGKIPETSDSTICGPLIFTVCRCQTTPVPRPELRYEMPRHS